MAVFPTRLLEIEFDTGVWTDVFPYCAGLGSRRGRNRESGAFETGSLTFTLRNADRRFDPDHTTGPHYGKLRPNRRVRCRNTWPAITHLALPGTSGAIASTPDSVPLSITGDIDLRAKVSATDWTPAAVKFAFAKEQVGARSYGLGLNTTGALLFRYSTDGTTPLQWASPLIPAFVDGSTHWIRATRVSATGVIAFYWSDDGSTWTALGTQPGAAGAIYDSSVVVEIGARAGADNWAGNVYRVELRNGIDGTAVASPSFDQTNPNGSLYTSPTTLLDPQGNVWTRQGAATFPTTTTTYPVWLGYIDRIVQIPAGPNAGDAEFTCSDFFKILNRVELPESVYIAEVLADSPKAWWRLADPVGSTTAAEEVAGRTATVNGSVTFGAGSLISRDVGDSITPNPVVVSGSVATPAGIIPPTESVPTGTGDFTVEWVANFGTSVSGADQPLLTLSGNGTQNDLTFGISGLTGGQLYPFIRQSMSGGTGDVYNKFTSSPTLDDGAPHHIAFVRSGTTVTLYVDGISRGSIGGINANVGSSAYFGSAGTAPTAIRTGMLLSDLAFYPTALSAARVLARSDARKVGGQWAGDLPGPRLERILALAAVPAEYLGSVDAGTTTLQSTDLGGTALAYAQKVEETELGALFVARDGKLRFIGRQTGWAAAAAAVTLVDDDSGAGIPYRAAGADVDEARIVTRARVSRAGSYVATYKDTAAADEFELIDETHSGLLHSSDTYSRQYAEWIVSAQKTPTSRVGAVTLELTRDPTAMYPAILGLEIGDRVTLKRKPQNVGAVSSLDMRVEAISHETDGNHWRTTLQLSPFPSPAGLPVFTWDQTRWDQMVWGF